LADLEERLTDDLVAVQRSLDRRLQHPVRYLRLHVTRDDTCRRTAKILEFLVRLVRRPPDHLERAVDDKRRGGADSLCLGHDRRAAEKHCRHAHRGQLDRDPARTVLRNWASHLNHRDLEARSAMQAFTRANAVAIDATANRRDARKPIQSIPQVWNWAGPLP
jgi:hypothetical protein